MTKKKKRFVEAGNGKLASFACSAVEISSKEIDLAYFSLFFDISLNRTGRISFVYSDD